MEGPDQATLKKLWTSGRRGTLCPKEMMKAWGIAWCMKNHFKKEVNYEAIPPRNSEKAPKKFRCPETAAGGGPTTQGRRQRRRAERNHFLNSETPRPPRRLLHETGTGGPVHSGVIYCELRQVPRPGPVTFQYYIGPQKGAFARGSLITRVPGHALFDTLWARDSLISAAGV